MSKAVVDSVWLFEGNPAVVIRSDEGLSAWVCRSDRWANVKPSELSFVNRDALPIAKSDLSSFKDLPPLPLSAELSTIVEPTPRGPVEKFPFHINVQAQPDDPTEKPSAEKFPLHINGQIKRIETTEEPDAEKFPLSDGGQSGSGEQDDQ